jgi:hypothetical protein
LDALFEAAQSRSPWRVRIPKAFQDFDTPLAAYQVMRRNRAGSPNQVAASAVSPHNCSKSVGGNTASKAVKSGCFR